MPDASTLRDSTQIVLSRDALDSLDASLDDEFVVTVVSESDARCRIIGSPVEIKAVTEFLTKRGINLA